MEKNARQNAIIKLIENNEIDTQDQLTELLNREGFNVSQATVSRDIKKLDLIKVDGIGKKFKYAKPIVYVTEIPDGLKNMIKHMLVSVESANNLVVVKTHSGTANAMAAAIDGMHFKNVLGTIAGDDTILVIVKSSSDAAAVVNAVKKI